MYPSDAVDLRFALRLLYAFLAIPTIIACPTKATAQGTAFVDRFDDGQYDDGNPVSWVRIPPPFGNGELSIEDGSLLVTPGGSALPFPGMPSYRELDLVADGLFYDEVSITVTRAKLGEGDALTVVGALDTYIDSNDDGKSVIAFLRSDGQLGLNFWVDSQIIQQERTFVPFLPDEGDVRINLTVMGDTVELSAWPADTEVPNPAIDVPLPQAFLDHSGRVLIGAGNYLPTQATIAFRDVVVVPEPSGLILLTAMMACLPIIRRVAIPRR